MREYFDAYSFVLLHLAIFFGIGARMTTFGEEEECLFLKYKNVMGVAGENGRNHLI